MNNDEIIDILKTIKLDDNNYWQIDKFKDIRVGDLVKVIVNLVNNKPEALDYKVSIAEGYSMTSASCIEISDEDDSDGDRHIVIGS